MRALWRCLVPGSLVPAAVWAVAAGYQLSAERYTLVALDLLLVLLNLYSWDWQLRRDRGEQMP